MEQTFRDKDFCYKLPYLEVAVSSAYINENYRYVEVQVGNCAAK